MRNVILCLFSVAAIGCGGTDSGVDGGGSTPDLNLTGQHLQSGTYNTGNVTTVSDGCMIAPISTTLLLTNTGNMLTLGTLYNASTTPMFSPPAYALGSGSYLTSTTASTSNAGVTVTLGDGCTSMRTDTTNFTFTGTNAAMVDWTHTESGYATSCAMADLPPSDPCTSHFQFAITM